VSIKIIFTPKGVVVVGLPGVIKVVL